MVTVVLVIMLPTIKKVNNMTDRRMFLKSSAVAVSALTLGSVGMANASSGGDDYAGIIYTAKNPGKWAKKVGSHAPVITVKGNEVTVETKHGMVAAHFIVRHTLVLDEGKVLGTKTFSPTDKAISSYTLPDGYKGDIYATSFCNLHDFWVTETEV